MGLYQKFWWIFAAVIVANVLAGGYVFDRIGTAMVSPEAEPLRKATTCAIGAIILPPVVQVYGVYVFLPAISDVMIAIVLTLVIVTILRIVGFDFRPLHTVLIGVGIWFLVKMTALVLVLMSGDECIAFVFTEADQFLSPMAALGTAVTPLLLWKTILWKIGMRRVGG